jgi:hypothetical protein
MMRGVTIVLTGATLLVGTAGSALAFHCPALVKDCQATADIVAKRPGSDKAAVDKGRKGCDEAMKLHAEGKHKASMIRAGEAIAQISEALQ